MICNSNLEVIPVLIACLRSTSIAEDYNKSDKQQEEARRLSCLILNNLSIPNENKAVMALGDSAADLLALLTRIVEDARPESYLCIICIYNLSFLDDAADFILHFRPTSAQQQHFSPSRHRHTGSRTIHSSNPSGGHDSPMTDGSTLIRVLERVVLTYAPFLQSEKKSVESETVRYTVGILANLCVKSEDRLDIIIQTDLPRFVVQILRTTCKPVNRWTSKSLEEFSMELLSNMSKYSSGRNCLGKLDTFQAMMPIVGMRGIHAYRARLIQSALEGIHDGKTNETQNDQQSRGINTS